MRVIIDAPDRPDPLNKRVVLCSQLNRLRATDDGENVIVSGYSSSLDGGQGTFVWDVVSTAAADQGLVFGTGAAGRWRRVYSGPIRQRWFGAKGDDSTDDTVAIKRWIGSILTDGQGIWDPGTYRISSTLNVRTHGIRLLNPSSTNPFANDVLIKWDSPNSSSFAINMCGLRQTIEGVSITAAAGRHLHGGINCGSVSGSTVLYNVVRNCSVGVGPAVGEPTLDYGFGVGIWSEGGILVTFEQSFSRFENCQAHNFELAGFRIEGCANSIDTTIDRCLILNGLGISGSRRWVSASNAGITGLESVHPYGVGIWCAGTASGGLGFNPIALRVTDVNFLFCETALFIDGIQMYSVMLDGGDTEGIKKLLRAHWSTSNIGAVMSLRGGGGRFTIEAYLRSLGPANNGLGYPASDTRWLDVIGYGVHMDSMGVSCPVNLTSSMRVFSEAGSLVCTNCTLPSTAPFDPGTDVWSFGCWGGAAGLGSRHVRLVDGHYGGMPFASGSSVKFARPTHFDSIQTYQRIALDPAELTGTQPSMHWYPDPIRAQPSSHGRAAIVGTNQVGSVAFSASLGTLSARYDVMLTALTASGGSPHSGSLHAIAINKTVAGFDAWVPASPGAGVTNIYRWEIVNDL